MKKVFCLMVVIFGVGTFSAVVPDLANAQELCMNLAGDVSYRISYQTATNTYQISGIRKGAGNNPIVGAAFVNSNGNIIIGWSVLFNYGGGGWAHPNGITNVNYTLGTHDTTYYGNPGNAIIQTSGVASVVPCGLPPAPESAEPAQDPNAQ